MVAYLDGRSRLFCWLVSLMCWYETKFHVIAALWLNDKSTWVGLVMGIERL